MSMRCYGFFRCSSCNKLWESSHAYCDKIGGVLKPMYKQDCKDCQVSCLPYKVERLTCSICDQQDCTCTREEKEERHTDLNKPHLSHLCERCKKGLSCVSRRY
ncbi:zygote arrest protein 1-like [Gigantopelta aegis]|uniref:zygote arrest protein 1-like n=1 Tax=Gigantopelta aegis TaxID=1735272 RepID=UPI001B88AEA5|nr:zygote arrest protein 1-like [Gigantopelta aegis]